ncbi:hypothetical protein MCEGEM3_02683 [Oxalobacteraceae bacterium]|jgi:hypothetical protein
MRRLFGFEACAELRIPGGEVGPFCQVIDDEIVVSLANLLINKNDLRTAQHKWQSRALCSSQHKVLADTYP